MSKVPNLWEFLFAPFIPVGLNVHCSFDM